MKNKKQIKQKYEFSFFNVKDVSNFSYYVIPKELITNEEFADLNLSAKFIYSLMLNRLNLSIKNNWVDDNNHIYIYYQIKTLMKDSGIVSNNTVIKLLNILKEFGLIQITRQGNGKPNKIYVGNFLECNKCTSRSAKNAFLEVQKVHRNKHNINNINIDDDEYTHVRTRESLKNDKKIQQIIKKLLDCNYLDENENQKPYIEFFKNIFNYNEDIDDFIITYKKITSRNKIHYNILNKFEYFKKALENIKNYKAKHHLTNSIINSSSLNERQRWHQEMVDYISSIKDGGDLN